MKNYAAKEYYKILGLSYDATFDDIKKAFRKAAMKYHPDVNKDGEHIFLQLKEAYDVLSDEKERKNYDFVKGYDVLKKQKQDEINRKSFQKRKNHDSVRKAASEGFYKKNQDDLNPQNEIKDDDEKLKNYNGYHKENSFSDTLKNIFNNLFYKKTNDNSDCSLNPKDGDDINMFVEISYKEAVNGTNRKINVLHTEICPVCEGKKFTNGNHCKYCKGTGEVSIHKKLNVKIPPHTENNKKIRLKGEGTKGLKGGKNGNLYLIVRITDDSFFKFDGNNVLCEVEITPYEAALGCEKEIKTLSGIAKLKVPSGTSSGQKFRLAKEGLFDENNKIKGDQIVTIKIKINENLSEREKQLYEELKNISKEKKE